MYAQSAQAWITQFYLQTTPCLPFLRGIYQMSPPQQQRQQTSNCSSLLINRPRKDERLSWPSWLIYSGWLTHISGHPLVTSRAQDTESTSVKDQCYTAGPRHQPRLSPVNNVKDSVSQSGWCSANRTRACTAAVCGQNPINKYDNNSNDIHTTNRV